MDIQVTNAASPAEALRALGDGQFDFVSLHMNCDSGSTERLATSKVRNLHGATSCLGAMTMDGATDGATAFAVVDPQGAYGTALVEAKSDMRSASADAALRALIAADRLGEIPDLVWVSATPGAEEDVLAGIEDVVGEDVPIIGGSAADNSVAGDWFVFDAVQSATSGVVVSVLFPSVPISFAYQNGYSPTDNAGTVTKIDGRKLIEIDHKPAMDVYSEWTGGAVRNSKDTPEGAAILSDSTMWPLGREIGEPGDIPFHLLAHPAVAHVDGSMDLFASVDEGERVILMHGTRKGLVERAGRVSDLRVRQRDDLSKQPLGALMIYCGGCMLSVREQLGEVVGGVNDALGGAPFLGAFTFGEQGNLIRGGNRHGNLMISCIVFG